MSFDCTPESSSDELDDRERNVNSLKVRQPQLLSGCAIVPTSSRCRNQSEDVKLPAADLAAGYQTVFSGRIP
jgi:hypothetical protein